VQGLSDAANPHRTLQSFVPPRRTVKSTGQLSILVAAATAAYWPTISDLLAQWRPTENVYGQGWFILLAIAAMCVRSAPQVVHCGTRFSAVAFAGLLASLAVWAAGFAADIGTVQSLALLPILAFGTASIFGFKAARILAVPFLTFALILPIWDPLTAVLQPLSVALTHLVTGLIGIPVFAQGTFLMIPEGTFEVQEGCAGLAFFLSAGVFALLAGEFCGMHTKNRVALVAASFAAAIALNWVRIVTIVLIGHLTNMQHPLVADHGVIGDAYFVIFVIVPVVLFARSIETHAPRAAVTNAGEPLGPSYVSYVVVVAVLAAALLAPVAARSWDAQRTAGLTVRAELPQQNAAWKLSETPLPWRPSHPGAAVIESASYASAAGGAVFVYLAAYLEESQRHELIGLYSYVAEDMQDSTVLDTQTAPVTRLVASNIVLEDGRRLRAWHWYQIGGDATADDLAAKALQIVDWFKFETPAAAGVIALATPCSRSCEAADAVLAEFAAAQPSLGEPFSVVEERTE